MIPVKKIHKIVRAWKIELKKLILPANEKKKSGKREIRIAKSV